jgi:hypothetical protein
MDWEPDTERYRFDQNKNVSLANTPFGGLHDFHQPNSYSQLNTVQDLTELFALNCLTKTRIPIIPSSLYTGRVSVQ